MVPIALALCLLALDPAAPPRTAAAGLGRAPAVSHAPGADAEFASRLQQANALMRAGAYARCESLSRSLMLEAQAAGEVQELDVAHACDLLAEAMRRLGKTRDPQTRQIAQQAVEIKARRLGDADPDLALSLDTLGGIDCQAGDYDQANRELEQAMAILRAHDTPDSLRTARVLNSLGLLRFRADRVEEARAPLDRSLAIREAQLGPNAPEVAEVLHNRAAVLGSTGQYDAALRDARRALTIRETALGPEHPEVAASCSSLASLLRVTGQYQESIALHARSRDIWEKAFGPTHMNVGVALNNLALAEWLSGDTGSAREHLERARSIFESAFGPEHTYVAIALENLGNIALELGDYEGAWSNFQRSLQIRRKALGENSPLVARCYHNMGLLDNLVGDYGAAKEVLQHELRILEPLLGSDHADVGECLSVLGLAMRGLGDSAGARPLLERALAIQQKAFGPNHPAVAEALSDLADVCCDLGDLRRARTLYEQAIALREHGHSTKAVWAPQTLAAYARLLWRQGDATGALARALEGEAAGREHLRLTARALSEREALRFAAERNSALDLVLSIAAASEQRDALWSAWDAVILGRALIEDEMAARRETLEAASDPGIAELATKLSGARQQLANLFARESGGESSDELTELLRRAQSDCDSRERALADASAHFRGELAAKNVGLAAVQSALPAQSAMVAFVRFDKSTPSSAAGGGAGAADKPVPSYLAFVQIAGATDPSLVPIGGAAEVDSLCARWRQAIAGLAEQGAQGVSSQGRQAEALAAGKVLRQVIWDPVVPKLGGASTVLVVPDGALDLINLASLPASDGSYLLEHDPLLHLLSAERDVVEFAAGPSLPASKGTGGLLAVGDPDFDVRPSSAGGRTTRLSAATSTVLNTLTLASNAWRGARGDCGDLASLWFEQLPGSAKEATDVCSLWRRFSDSQRGPSHQREAVVRLTGRRASEAAFKNHAAGQRVLHLATHGFFLNGDCSIPLVPAPQADSVGAGDEQPASMPRAMRAPPLNPLLLSGLAFAGANHREAVGPSQEDGILTAAEIASLDLHSVEWAVLSACETGLGRVQAREGVLGLQRGFRVAGARTVIMSLWPVDDQTTRDWMKALYRARFESGMSTAASVREASLAVLHERRDSGLPAPPFLWGSFVAIGDWH